MNFREFITPQLLDFPFPLCWKEDLPSLPVSNSIQEIKGSLLTAPRDEKRAPMRIQLWPAPAGSSRLQPAPAGSSRFQPAPDGGCNWFYSINRHFTECLWRSETYHFKKYNFFVKKTYPLTLLSFSQLRYSLEQWKLDIKWGKRRCLQNSKVVFCNILQVTFS